ncbi:hypothetical protein BSKO_04426 [Bryopsis sp. KO-2023]|nr:hypothetical protein BSKO_04426 [Bryopsis sp. KO-2023]
MALGRILTSYSQKYIQTGSAEPIVHVVTTVGFGGYVYHSFLHWLESSAAEKAFNLETQSLQATLDDKQKAIERNQVLQKAALKDLEKSKVISEHLAMLQKEGPVLAAELKTVQGKLEEHLKSGPHH